MVVLQHTARCYKTPPVAASIDRQHSRTLSSRACLDVEQGCAVVAVSELCKASSHSHKATKSLSETV